MMTSVVEFKSVWETLSETYPTVTFTNQEMIDMKAITEKMDLLSIVLRLLEKSDSPTMHQVFPLLVQLREEFCTYTSPLTKILAIALEDEISYYFGIIWQDPEATFDNCTMFIISTFLDPRLNRFHLSTKKKVVKNLFKNLLH